VTLTATTKEKSHANNVRTIKSTVRRVRAEPPGWSRRADRGLAYLPRLVGAAVLVLVAWLIATVLKKIIMAVLKAAKIDEKFGSATGAEGTGASSPTCWLGWALTMCSSSSAWRANRRRAPRRPQRWRGDRGYAQQLRADRQLGYERLWLGRRSVRGHAEQLHADEYGVALEISLVQPENQVALSWVASPGETYALEETPNLSPPTWTPSPSGGMNPVTVDPAGQEKYWRLWQVPNNMVWIPPGTFLMGSPETEAGRWIFEGPQTTVTISQGFWMGKHEVT
jgi:hypothetical protein